MTLAFRLLLAATIAISVTAPAAAKKKTAEACAKPAEIAAFELYTVQTDLMVSARSCGIAERYNAFVTANQPALAAANAAIKSFFRKRGGEKAMNDYATRLANNASTRFIGDRMKFCVDAWNMFEGIASPQRGELAAFIATLPVAQLHGVKPCTPPAPASAPAPKPKS
jgi:hypothetical protein